MTSVFYSSSNLLRASRACVCALAILASARAIAQHGHRPEREPDVVRTAEGTAEAGILNDAEYRIDVPAEWNHEVVVFYHGYADRPVRFRADGGPGRVVEPLLQRGYAVIQSGYSDTGWALGAGYRDTEALRQYFLHEYGKPRETYAAGVSMGGTLTMISMELNSRVYAGGLDLCGAVGPSSVHLNRRFALRAAFDFYFPGVLPPIDPVPVNFTQTEALRQRVLAALRGNPEAASAMRALTGLHTDVDVARDMLYFTYIVGDLQRKAGGNPFTNQNYIYSGTTNETHTDEALNDGVRRYRANSAAQRYLAEHYSPSGRLPHPMLALATAYDPVIPASELALYSDEVDRAGYGENFVQQYVHREGHCTFSPEEVGHAFDELVRWVHTGTAPAPGLLR